VFLSREQNEKGATLSKLTQNYYLIALRALLSYFLTKDIVSVAPDKVTLPKDATKEKSVKFLTLEQVEKLLDAPKGTDPTSLRDKAILEILFSTGLRIAELVNLNREQFDSIENKEDFELGVIGKGSRPRTVYFSERALAWLKKYLRTRGDKQKALFINYRSRDQEENRLTTRSIERIIKKYAILAGVPIFTTPHTLRHSYATDLLSQGVDLRSIQEFLGHKNIVTTQIYTHVTNKRLRDIHRQFHSGKNLKSPE
jgi:site-specific recombinase XerD